MDYRVLGPITAMGASPTSKLERRLLAALLVYRGSVVSEDRLVDCVWPDSPPKSASNSLQSKVSRLRRLVGRDRLVRVGEGYQLHCAPSDCDADRFDDLALAAETMPTRERVPLLEEALGLWTGQPFGEFSHDLFVLSSATALKQRKLEVEQRVAEGLIELGQFGKAVERGEALIVADPFREAGWQIKMRALHSAGRSVEALRVFQAAHSFFVDETGLPPSARLRAAETEILDSRDSEVLVVASPNFGETDQRAVPESEVATRTFDLPLKRPELVSRRSASAALRGALANADAGRPSVVYVEGVEGIGKTRLVDSIGAAARSDGWQVLSGRCLPDLELPLGPIGQLMSSLAIARPADLAVDGAESSNTAIAVLDLVGRITEERSVVVIEDAHWGDAGFCSALELMAAELESMSGSRAPQTLIVVTSRPPDGDGEDVGDRLRRNPITEHVVPAPLEESEVSELMRSMTGLRPSGRAASRLTDASLGIPGAIVRIVERLRADGQLLVRAGCLDVDVDVTSLRALEVSERPPENWNEASSEVRAVLALLAVSGILTVLSAGSVVTILASALGIEDSRVRDLLEQAREAGLLRRRGVLDFRTERTRVYVSQHSAAESVGPALVALAETLAVSPDLEGSSTADLFPDVVVHVLEVAESMGLAVDRHELASWRLAAAEMNLTVGSFANAASYLEPLVGGRTLETLEDGRPIDLAYGVALYRAHDEFRAQSVLKGVAERLSTEGKTEHEIMALSAISRIAFALGDQSDLSISAATALPMLREFAERVAPVNPSAAATALGLLVEQATVIEDFDQAESDLAEAMRLTADLPTKRPAEVEFASGLLGLFRLDLADARRHLEVSLLTSDPWVSAWSLGRLCLVEVMAGRLPAARQAIDRALDAQQQLKFWSEIALTRSIEASYFAARGEFEIAVEVAGRAEADAIRSGARGPLLFSLPVAAFCYGSMGDFNAARQSLSRLDNILGRPQWQFAALLALQEGDVALATSFVEERVGRLRPRLQLGRLPHLVAVLATTAATPPQELPPLVSGLADELKERRVRFTASWPVDIARYWTNEGGATP